MNQSRSYHLHNGKKGAALALRVSPNEKKNEIASVLDDGTILVHLAATKIDERADEMLLNFLAEKIGVPVKKLEIIAGAGAKEKIVTILDTDPDMIDERIYKSIAK